MSSSSTAPASSNTNAFCCGENCRCGDNCTCTESLCRCEASSVLNSLSPVNRMSSDDIHEDSSLARGEFWIDGMTCTMCSQTIERAVQALPIVENIAVSLGTDSALVDFVPSSENLDVDMETIRDSIEDVGFSVQRLVLTSDPRSSQANESGDASNPNESANMEDLEERWQRLQERQDAKVTSRRNAFLWSLVATLPILVMTMILPHDNVMSRTHITLPGHHPVQLQAFLLWILATPVQFVAGWEFYKMAYYGIRAGSAGMDVLIALGTSASYGYALYGVLSGDHELAHFFETSAVLICFVLAGKWMQALAVRRTSQAMSQLMQLQAKTAVKVTPFKDRVRFHPRKDPYREETLPIQQIKPGDIVKVIRGASVPADGKILFGEISVDESMVTGESVPVLKTPGSVVLGGTVCVESSINDSLDPALSNSENANEIVDEENRDVGAAFVEVTGVGSATALAQIVQLVHEAQTRTVPVQSFADAVASVFVPTVCAISLVTFLVWYALCSSHTIPDSWYAGEDPMTFSLMFAIACLVISCPCALGLATPTAVMVGTGVAAKIGILMKGGEALEIANDVDAVIFDKTGTLTKGKPTVTDFLRLEDGIGDEDLLWLLGSLERSSEHPLARAVVEYSEDRLGDGLSSKPFGQPSQFRAMTGRGATCLIGETSVSVGNRAFAQALGHTVNIVAEECMVSLEEDGKTAILVIVDGVIHAVLGISDEIKPDAAASIAYLRERLGVDVWIITGDNQRTANAVCSKLNLPLNRVLAEALPAVKLEKVRELQEQGRVVAMVGDGVNDSPALAQADIGLSLGSGAEIANETSDVILVKGDVGDVCAALDMSRVIFRRIQWNFVWSLIYNCLGIPIAAGVAYPLVHTRLPPSVAALAMALSSISVVASSLKLRLYKPPNVLDIAARSASPSQIRAAGHTDMHGSSPEELRANLLENDHLDHSEVTDATELIDNRTLSRMEEGDQVET